MQPYFDPFLSRIPGNDSDSSFDPPIKSFFKLHGRFGIGSVHCVDAILTSVGRDGVLHNILLDRELDTAVDAGDFIRRGSSARLKFSCLEKIVEFRGKKLVLGFHSDKFVVYNLSDQVRGHVETCKSCLHTF